MSQLRKILWAPKESAGQELAMEFSPEAIRYEMEICEAQVTKLKLDKKADSEFVGNSGDETMNMVMENNADEADLEGS